jgi:carotenoid cleavage dioxygenase
MREWRLDRTRGTATERQLTYDPCDFPVELEGDLIVGLAGERDGGPDYTRCRGVARVGPSGELDRRLHQRGSFGGEFRPVMTGDGMVLAGLITWPDASELLILDPSDLSAEPLARVHVPVAIAAGLHSAWLPGE